MTQETQTIRSLQGYKDYLDFDEKTGFSKRAGFQLSPLQQADVNQFACWKTFTNRYEVGGGKTVVGTAVSLIKGFEVNIVVVPPILLRPWTRWLEKVSEGVVQYSGNPKARAELRPKLKTAKWVVLSHDIFRRDYSHIAEAVQDRYFQIVVDEAQAVKNVESVLFRKVAAMGAGNDVQLLTATPVNKPEDAYAFIKLATPHLYRSWSHFESAHIASRDPVFRNITGYKNLDLLGKNLDMRSIVRTKEELHGYKNDPLYPDCTYELAPEHQKLYTKLIEEQLLEMGDEKIDASTAQKLYHASQQMVLNWGAFAGDPSLRSAAYDLLDLTIEQTECNSKNKSKLIVWTLYKMSSRAVWQYLLGLGIKAVAAYSEVKSQDSFDQFMEDDNTRILVAQPQSAGAGLNPQAVCWESLALETSPNVMHWIQSSGRIDRMGQKHMPTIRMAVAENTIQVALREALFKNSDLVSQVDSREALRKVLLGKRS